MRSITVGVAALVAALVWTGVARAQFGPAPVYLEPAEKRSIRRSVELVGTAGARRRSVIGAEVPGRVETMAVDAGDYVKAGQPLCHLRALPTELQLKQAEGQLAAAQANLRKMEEGFRKEEIAQAEARRAAAQAGFERWSQEYTRTKRLLADGASTPAEMDTTEAAYRQAKELLAEAEAYLALVRAGNRIEDIDQARGQVAAQTAAVAELSDALDKMTVTMPFNGFVVKKQCEVGEWVGRGAPVVEVVDLDVVRVELNVPERHLKGIRKGHTAPVVFDSAGTQEFEGTVSQIVPASAEATHTVTVRVDVPNVIADGRPAIAAGLVARVWLPVGEEHEALLVPKDALIRQGGRDLVYTVAEEPPPDAKAQAKQEPKTDAEKAQAKMVAENQALIGRKLAEAGSPAPAVKFAVAIPVRLVGGYGRFMEVESEQLKPGTLVVTRGTYLMAHGAPVHVRPKEKSSASPQAAKSTGDAE